MGMTESDDAVVIQKGKKAGEPHVITVNCPDKTGLGCDICRIILDFGLYITKGDVTTDGLWCYVVLWVVPHSNSLVIRWSNLKNQLLSVCPSCSSSFLLNLMPPRPRSTPVYLLKFFCLDRKGLLHDVTQVLCELELTIQTVKVTTTPDGRVLDLFFITDNKDLLQTKGRQDETLEQLHSVLGESCISCELQLAGPEYECHQNIPSLSPTVAEELFRSELSDEEARTQALSPDMTKLKNSIVTVDNSLSPTHTLLQICCVDHKGLLYDVLRPLKDRDIKICYGRFSPQSQGYRDLDLFIQLIDGKKIVDPDKQRILCSRLRAEMLHPLRVTITNRGPDTELLVANPVELSGKGRPRVFYDVTLSLKMLGICIFSAEIGRYSACDREWEVYRFLLDENCPFQLSNNGARSQVVDRVRRILMGW
ncbi:PREDICTED: ACT domain-containing protein ACR9-like [Tarenaya hassleriana]|uniref:ACT domain-containing protein ACR9-like n=1 Tax=Tarenaya hassleriana TaxID=28532 RepID=UPI00053C21C7|nr:PREDICTED: ACT domain-containing protein ACR9-like [Tarenaya hassleriana]